MKITKAALCRKSLAFVIALSLCFGSNFQTIAFAEGDAATEQTAKEELENVEQEEASEVDPLISDAKDQEQAPQAEDETKTEEAPQVEDELKAEDAEAMEQEEVSFQTVGVALSLSSNEAEETLATNEADFEFDGAGTITGYTGSDTDVVIPEKIGGVEVNIIGEGAFSNVYNIVFPKTITEIEDYAFDDECLETVTFKGETPPELHGDEAATPFNWTADIVFYCPQNALSDYEAALEIFMNMCGGEILPLGDTTEKPETPTEPQETEKEKLDKLYNFELNADDTYTLTEFKVKENGNDKITEIVIPSEYDGKAITKIGKDAFNADGKGWSKILSIEIPDSVTEIGDWAFYMCKAATSITLSNNLTTIGENAFQRCDALTEITIPASVETIKPLAFTMCEGLKNIKVEEGNQNYKDIDGVLFDKAGETLINYPAGNAKTEYSIPDGTVKIENDAFKLYYQNNSAKLKKVSFPLSLKEIGDRAFMQTKLTEITIVPGVKVGNYVFDQCKDITKVNIAEGVTEIGEAQFYALENCKEITLPSTLKKIGYRAFDRLGATEIVLPEGLEEIGEEAFECSQLKSVTIPASVKKIGDRAFYLSKIENVNFAENGKLNSIGKFAFTHCKSLNNVVIPSTVKTLESGCFSHCYALTNITIPDSVTTLGDVVFAGSKFSEISLPDSITTIGNGTFRDCMDLVSAKLPAKLEALGTCTFEHCQKLQEAVFPETMKIKSLPSDTFYDCRTIKHIYLPHSIARTEACSLSLCKADPLVEFANKNLRRSKFDCFVLDFENIGESYYELIDAEKQIYKLKAEIKEEENQIYNEMNKTEDQVRSRKASSMETLCGCQGAKDQQFAPTCSPTFKFKPSASSGDVLDKTDSVVSPEKGTQKSPSTSSESYSKDSYLQKENVVTAFENKLENSESVFEEAPQNVLPNKELNSSYGLDFYSDPVDKIKEDSIATFEDSSEKLFLESNSTSDNVLKESKENVREEGLSKGGKIAVATATTVAVTVGAAAVIGAAGSSAAAASTVAASQAVSSSVGLVGKFRTIASKLFKFIKK